MNIKLIAGFAKKHLQKNAYVNEALKWKADSQDFALDVTLLSNPEVDTLIQATAGIEDLLSQHNNLVSLKDIRENPKSLSTRKLPQMEEALIAALLKTPHKWLVKIIDGNPCPMYVTRIVFEPRTKYNPPRVAISMICIERGLAEKKQLYIHRKDLSGGKTVYEILLDNDLMLETPELIQQYYADMAIYREYVETTGNVYTAKGSARSVGRDAWNAKIIPMVRDGVNAKVIMDDLFNEKTRKENDSWGSWRRDSSKAGLEISEEVGFWKKRKVKKETNKIKNDDDDDGEDSFLSGDDGVEGDAQADDVVILPVFPIVKVFDLGEHEFVTLHVKNLTHYEFDSTLGEKLVIPENHKELVGMLVHSSGELMEDIIKGKTGGVIVIATGPPGTGKTLTAEVFSELVKKALYVVQCSQLGTDEEQLEQNLEIVLLRASRWGAILLIDEADVYVRQRGDDIQQNAIVGVFLRMLEYYRGILFMTSNRANVIDDAIMSRAVAHIEYQVPDQENLKKIWNVLSKQFKMDMPNKLADDLTKEFLGISGRTVKNLLKLARLMAKQNKKPLSLEMFQKAATFIGSREKKPM